MGPPSISPEPSITLVHSRASDVLPWFCAMADKTCNGKMDVALRRDAPEGLIRRSHSQQGRRYFIGDPLVGYFRLCRSHHRRYDGISPSPAARALGNRLGASKGGKIGGPIGGRKCSPAKTKAAQTNLAVARHTRWHANRGIMNSECELCQ